MNALSALDCALLNRVQKNFPLESHPFATIAQQLGMTESAVVERLQALAADGAISRFGAVFKPNVVLLFIVNFYIIEIVTSGH